MAEEMTILRGGNNSAVSLWAGLEEFSGQAYIQPSIMSGFEEIAIGRREATRQARNIERKSEAIRGGIDRKTNTVVGADLFPRLTPDWRTLGMSETEGPKWAARYARAGEALLRSWMIDRRKVCDAEGHHTFGGLMWMAFRNVTGPDGETFGIIHYDVQRARRLNTPWATTVTVLDPQRVETPPQHSDRSDVVDGKLLDPYGRMLGFYFNKMPRGPIGISDLDYGYCPRENRLGRPQGWHYFAKHRGAAQRGITALATIVRRSGMFDKFDEATLGAAIVAAAMATYVKTKGTPEEARENLAPAASSTEAGFGGRFGFYQKLGLRIGKARVPVLPLEDELHIEAADRSAGDPTKFRRGFLAEFASAIGGMTAEALSLDYSQVNYSSARAALIDIWRGVLVERSMFNSSPPALIVDAVLEECITKGWMDDVMPPAGTPGFYEEREAYTRCVFTGPPMGWVDPKKEAEAAQIRTDPSRPLSTLTEESAAQGRSFDEVIDERAREQQALKDAGLLPGGELAGTPPAPVAAGNPDDEEREPPEQREEQ